MLTFPNICTHTHAGLGSAKFSTLGWDGFINVLGFFGLI